MTTIQGVDPRLLEMERELAAMVQQQEEDKLAGYSPYMKQMEFHNAGLTHSQRLFMASNQSGKTWAGAYEMAMHLTGRYPDWWLGYRFEGPIRAWCCGESANLHRDAAQKLLFGEPGNVEAFGTGTVPKDTIVGDPILARGVANFYDTVFIRHATGKTSTLKFKTYEQGRTKFQADTIDLAWCDEEPPEDVYSELLTRLIARKGRVYTTFTPLKGMSAVVDSFLKGVDPSKIVISMTLWDAEHYGEDQIKGIIASWPEHEREARSRGVPMMGEGRVFSVAEEAIRCEPFAIPAHWARICGMDIGIDHPTAAAWLAWDRDTDTLYLYDCYRQRGANVPTNAMAIGTRGWDIPVSWPHDAGQREKSSGETIKALYKKHGLHMLPVHAQFPDGGNSVEAGVLELNTRMQTGRFKVFRHLEPFFEEFRFYHRKDGQIVKERDDLLSAARYALMMRRYARIPGWLAAQRAQQNGTSMARDIDYDVINYGLK